MSDLIKSLSAFMVFAIFVVKKDVRGLLFKKYETF